ncbi:MAG TPA: bifunctional pyr operon transcriptional regulator/uracil phosphoribosyltransferase PyrR [Candidatus Acidoferrales bacterium]|nr:bifunctional pyr operon transcriptional regulator/uracil phosphoribosyltransferase PyrR [Candidatus Acidoferrales bacterium]
MLLNDEAIERVIHRLAHEIIEKVTPVEDLALLGIRSRGSHLARRLAKRIEGLTGVMPRLAEIDVTPYRDDREKRGAPDAGHLAITVDDKSVVLVDDVINTGRTARAALELVTRLAKPRRVLVAVLVDRGSRELPIRADIVGKNFLVGEGERINVLLKECDGVDRVTVGARRREISVW